MITPNWVAEWPLVLRWAPRYGVDPYFVAAVRNHERGPTTDGAARAGFGEFGLPASAYPDYLQQLRGCCATARTHLIAFPRPFDLLRVAAGFRRLVYSAQFIASIAQTYAPVGVANDPNGLNQFWPTRVGAYYRTFVVKESVA